MLQYARMHRLETFLHSTRHTHTTQRMRTSTSVRAHACMLQHVHVQCIRTHPHTLTSYDYTSHTYDTHSALW
jgi:hypothetical protein